MQVVEDLLPEHREDDDDDRTRPATACRPRGPALGVPAAAVSARNIGSVPGGSMITNSVTKTSMKSCASDARRLTAGPPPLRRSPAPRSRVEHLGVGGVLAEPVALAGAVVVAGARVEQAQLGGQAPQVLALGRVVVAVVDLEAGQARRRPSPR